MRGIRALFVSDIHLRASVSDARLNSLIDRIAAQNADLLLLGGDYGEGNSQCARFFGALARLDFPLGIYGVTGNNDDPAALEGHMAKANAFLLKNHSTCIHLRGGRLLLGGCDECKYGQPQTKNLFFGDGYRILLSHMPVQPDCSCELMLCGHTHGGQMNFFGLTPYSIGFEYPMKHLSVRGLNCLGSMYLAVCSGIGVSRIPLRFGARSEILLLEFAP